jgi:exopolysaccharide biosynthesis polyprenyl glycosylphosphotransferase
MNKNKLTLTYLISDYLSAVISWTLFFVFRKLFIEPIKFGYAIPVDLSLKYYYGILIIPVLWVFLYYSSGFYKDIYRKSLLNNLGQTFVTTLLGSIVIFFTSILDDDIKSYQYYYYSLSALFALQYLLTFIPRQIITKIINQKFKKRTLGFNTLILGCCNRAVEIAKELNNQKISSGNKILGYIKPSDYSNDQMTNHLKYYGDFSQIKQVIEQYQIEEIIISLEPSDYHLLDNILHKLAILPIVVKISFDMYDIVAGKAKMNFLVGTSLIQITRRPLPVWQENVKHFIDIVISFLALVISSPICILLALGVHFSSKGPILYNHTRIGKYGKPFQIYKFRSMYNNAEENGPGLASHNDCRVTPFGKFMRKLKLDELPNFFNVLKGDMSLVGPRPERQYFINQIMEKAPYYVLLQKVKPGITSLGQVKFGYAKNVDEMVKRLKYDIIYLENMSLLMDMKILIYTVITVIKGRGI